MSRIFHLIISILIPGFLIAQCGPRYQDDIFSTVIETENILYGNNVTYSGASQDLVLDFYEPVGDTASSRALIILAHGGFFLTGDKNDGDMDDLCRAYAAKGYACASINYRLGWSGFVPDSIQLGEALIRAVQDAKAAVRFFHQDAATSNTYRIDTDNIFVGGSSAGGFIGVHYAAFNDATFAPTWAQSLIAGLGGLEGDSGNPGWPSDIQGGISYAGAIVDTSWMTGTTPIVSTHSENDGTVPYGEGPVVFLFFNIYNVMGSSLVHQKADLLGMPNAFLSFPSAGHVPHLAGPAEFAATVDFTVDFLYDIICAPPACQIPANATTVINAPTSATLSWDAVPGAFGYQVTGGPVGGVIRSFTTTSTSRTLNILTGNTTYAWQVRAYCPPDLSAYSAGQIFTTPTLRTAENPVIVYPNPADASGFTVLFPSETTRIRIVDMQGRMVKVVEPGPENTSVRIQDLSTGLYLLESESADGTSTMKVEVH